MAVSSSETGLRSGSGEFDNFVAFNALSLIVRELDSRKREEIQELLGRLFLSPYIAHEGYGVFVEPNYRKSREVPLVVEAFDEKVGWYKVDRDSDTYEGLVRYRKEFEPFFVGQSIERDIDGETYIFSADNLSRVKLTPDVEISPSYSGSNRHSVNRQ